jgi:transcriptional regulator with XRE-family HTH domain
MSVNGARIRELRERGNYTTKALSEIVGVSEPMISYIVQGQQKML